MATTLNILSSLLHLLAILLLHQNVLQRAAALDGAWTLLLSNTGVSAMHMQLLHTDRVVIIDRTDFGASNISLPNNICRDNPRDLTLQHDCTAHSVEYDVASNSVRPLNVFTNPFCSSGAVMPNGTLMHSGGFNDGGRNVRLYSPCSDASCDWLEVNNTLVGARWYSTSHILPDGRQIIVGGIGRADYEFYPKTNGADGSFSLPFLSETDDPGVMNNLYPFVFLNTEGNLFIFANNRAILLNYVSGSVVRTYPTIPGGDPRNYPSSGTAVLLPLRNLERGDNIIAEVLVCGGAPIGSYDNARNGTFLEALNTCGRIRINDPNPQWVMETMPVAKVMGDMLLLPNGNVLLINGASLGTADLELGRSPVLAPILYKPNNPIGLRFEIQNASSTPRMYHSTAVLVRDGRVLVSGSNTQLVNRFSGTLFPTDLTMEAFSPDYLDPRLAKVRPRITSPASQSQIGYGQELVIDFTAAGRINRDLISVTMFAPPFNTHSISMSQRLLFLSDGNRSSVNVTSLGKANYRAEVMTPGSRVLAPPGYYILFVVYREVPSEGIWVQIQ